MLTLTALVMTAVHAIEGLLHEVPPEEGLSKMLGDKAISISHISEDSVMSHPLLNALYIWTRDSHDGSPEIIKSGNITTETNFVPRQTFVIIHGFVGNVSNPWILHIKEKLLSRSSCNVVAVDWFAGYYYASYWEIAARVPGVGRVLAQMINQLRTIKGLDPSDIHLIGHSLGAHVAGFCAKDISPKVARISGLDPAGPSFRKVGIHHRLDQSDADYVDIIHTNGCPSSWWWDCFGIDENIGHTDFWPNGGVYQPACFSINKNGHTNGRNSSVKSQIGDACHHEMAYWYYVESLDYVDSGDSRFLARPCGPHNWPLYPSNCTCGSLPQFMGFNADARSPGIFYLATHPKSPFAKYDNGCPAELQSLPAKIKNIFLRAIICKNQTGYDTGCPAEKQRLPSQIRKIFLSSDMSYFVNCCYIIAIMMVIVLISMFYVLLATTLSTKLHKYKPGNFNA